MNFVNFLKSGKYVILTSQNPNKNSFLYFKDRPKELKELQKEFFENYPNIQEINEKLYSYLLKFLKSKKYKFIRCIGKYGAIEKSVIVFGVSETKALKLCRIFAQECVAHSAGLIYYDNFIQKRKRKKDEFNKDFDDFYTIVKVEGEKIKFRLGFSDKKQKR